MIVVARAYGVAETALAVALLDAHGIKVFAPSWYTASMQWYWTHALGGIDIWVPASQAGSALEILAEFPISHRSTTSVRRRLILLAFFIVAFLLTGFPAPPSGFYAAAARPVPPRVSIPQPVAS
jgi:hypothetical protein